MSETNFSNPASLGLAQTNKPLGGGRVLGFLSDTPGISLFNGCSPLAATIKLVSTKPKQSQQQQVELAALGACKAAGDQSLAQQCAAAWPQQTPISYGGSGFAGNGLGGVGLGGGAFLDV